jgi:hypothetical protein
MNHSPVKELGLRLINPPPAINWKRFRYESYAWDIIRYPTNYPTLNVKRYRQHIGISIPEHKDTIEYCSYNWKILGDEPIVIDGKEYHYESALVDVSRPHSVPASGKTREIFRISSVSKSYEEILEQLSYFKYGQEVTYEEMLEAMA